MDVDAPYRETAEAAPVTLTDDERGQMAKAGRRMRMGAFAGASATLAVLAGACATLEPTPPVLAAFAGIAVVVVVWLHGVLAAGAALARLGDRGADYRGLALALTSLRRAFAARATASVVTLVGLFLWLVVLATLRL
jgi:hypothetical protein